MNFVALISTIRTLISRYGPAVNRSKARGTTVLSRGRFCLLVLSICLLSLVSSAQEIFEGREISSIVVAYEDSSQGSPPEAFQNLAQTNIGERFAAVKIRDAIEALYETKRVSNITVEALAEGERVRLVFKVRPIAQIRRVSVRISPTSFDEVTEQELLVRTTLVQTGASVSETALRNSADGIVEYLRNRGYFQAEARIVREAEPNSQDQNIVFNVSPGERSTVASFDIGIAGASTSSINTKFKLQPGKPYSREDLLADVERIKQFLREENFLAARINEPRIVYDSETNRTAISITGEVGPTVEVKVSGENAKIGGSTQRSLLPVERDGSVDYAAIIEGERRLENYYQEKGYFFADVTVACSVDPPVLDYDNSPLPNGTLFLCSSLGSSELSGRKVEINYIANLDRRLKLVEIRIRGTELFTTEEISSVLESQTANILGIIPLFGYGRGYTSTRILEQDTATIRSLLRELGYRDATVRANLGASVDGANLIVTFIVEEGEPTKVSTVEIAGNSAFSDDELTATLQSLVGENFSIQKVRNGQRSLAAYYSSRGYYDASVTYSIDSLPVVDETEPPLFRVVYNIQNEGEPVFVDRILINGNIQTKASAIQKALAIRPGELLRATDIYASEQNLYSSDAFELVEILPQARIDRPEGGRKTDVIVDVKEQAPRLLTYGGGYSTDLGLSGFADVRHFNLLGNLWQGGARIRWSQRRQLIQLDFINPRFISDGEKRFAPLTITAQYQRDSTVTRFFRSAFDRGTFGIVQRLDEEGNAIDTFGEPTGDPTLNRLTVTAETNRTLSRKNRSIVFFKYRFEDVRIFNIDSLLIKDLLKPDERVRISGFGATFVRDTRKNCSIKYTILDIIARGGPGEPCKYSASDPTDGDYLTAEYNVSLPALGANVGFNKLQVSYNFYRRFAIVPGLRDAVFAARALIGVANLFSRKTEFPSDIFPGLENTLPISERFFAGGANTLRGFEFESAGPRVLVVPNGTYRNSDGEPVFLDPFTIPFGGNALAVVNLEARIPLTQSIRAVPFYDGGNVFLTASEIFKPREVPETDAYQRNLRATWTHTVGLGFRLKTPIGGEFGIDYGFLLNPPRFLIPQPDMTNAIIQLRRQQLHFRFSQAF